MVTTDTRQIERYEEGWTREMMTYWRERMLRLGVYDTGALYRSLAGSRMGGTPTTIEHKFLYYGIYVAAGTGRGYTKGNGGDLAFLKDWKTSTKHRKRRDWIWKKYFSSVMRLSETEAAFYGEAYSGLMAEALTDMIGGRAEKHIR